MRVMGRRGVVKVKVGVCARDSGRDERKVRFCWGRKKGGGRSPKF